MHKFGVTLWFVSVWISLIYLYFYKIVRSCFWSRKKGKFPYLVSFFRHSTIIRSNEVFSLQPAILDSIKCRRYHWAWYKKSKSCSNHHLGWMLEIFWYLHLNRWHNNVPKGKLQKKSLKFKKTKNQKKAIKFSQFQGNFFPKMLPWMDNRVLDCYASEHRPKINQPSLNSHWQDSGTNWLSHLTSPKMVWILNRLTFYTSMKTSTKINVRQQKDSFQTCVIYIDKNKWNF